MLDTLEVRPQLGGSIEGGEVTMDRCKQIRKLEGKSMPPQSHSSATQSHRLTPRAHRSYNTHQPAIKLDKAVHPIVLDMERSVDGPDWLINDQTPLDS